MLKENSAWYGWPRATENLYFKGVLGMSTAEVFHLILQSDYGDQNTNSEEPLRIEEKVDANK